MIGGNMEEQIYNLFLFISDDNITEIGLCVHSKNGTDNEKIEFLQKRVAEDCLNSVKYAISELPYNEYKAKYRLGTHLTVFEPLFIDANAPQNPLCCVTPIIDGKPYYDVQSDMVAFNVSQLQDTQHFPGHMPDYLQKYLSDEGFDFSNLINDDFLLSIKLLWNNQKYVSAAKLLMSMIDSIAFIEFDDIQGNFQNWLNEYACLSKVGITSSELWEFRNSLLHMTNLNSRKVNRGQLPSLVMYIGDARHLVPPNSSSEKYFSLKVLIDETNQALGRWLLTYSEQPEKFEKFVERYDLTISDARMATIAVT
jgi:hypothetical protein